jgi:hypothetical protein
MKIACPRCGGDHRGWEIAECNRIRSQGQQPAKPKKATKAAANRPDPAKKDRKAYMREYMAQRRAKGKT